MVEVVLVERHVEAPTADVGEFLEDEELCIVQTISPIPEWLAPMQGGVGLTIIRPVSDADIIFRRGLVSPHRLHTGLHIGSPTMG